MFSTGLGIKYGHSSITKKFTSMGEIKYNLIKSQQTKYSTGKNQLLQKKLVTIPQDILWALLLKIPILHLAGLHHLQEIPSASSGQYPGRKIMVTVPKANT